MPNCSVPRRSALSLEEAMTRFAAGDDRAFARVVELARDPIVRAITCATRDSVLAEDVAQETFVKIWHARETYRPGSSVLPWARTIARRTLIDVLRKSRLEREAARQLGATTDRAASGCLTDQLDARRASRTLFTAMRRLPRKQAEALYILGTEGISLVDLARRLGDSALAVRLRVFRARSALRAELALAAG